MARRTSNKPPPIDPVTQSEPPPLLTEDIEVDLDSPLTETKSNGNGAVPADLAGPEIEVETTPPVAPPVDDEKEAMRKRVAELEASEKLNRDYQAQAQQAIEQLTQRDQQAQWKVNQSQWNAAKSEYDATVSGIGAANSEINALKEQVRQAGVEGNWEVIAEAQAQIGSLSYDLRSLEQRKGQLEQWANTAKQQFKQQPKQQQRQQPQPPPDPIEATIAAAPIPDRAKTWLREHREYMSDPEKNAKLQAFHWDAKRETGGEYTDAYFGRMEELLGLKQGESKPAAQSTPSVRTGGSVSAPPTREALSMSTGRSSTPTKVTLSGDEREVARGIAESRNGGLRPGDPGWMSQAEAEREYARQKLKMIKEKAN